MYVLYAFYVCVFCLFLFVLLFICLIVVVFYCFVIKREAKQMLCQIQFIKERLGVIHF